MLDDTLLRPPIAPICDELSPGPTPRPREIRYVLRLCLLIMLCFVALLVSGCPSRHGTAPSPVKKVTWVSPTGGPVEEFDGILRYGVSWRALIWGSRLYFMGAYKGQTTLCMVDPVKGTGRFFKPWPKELDRLSTLMLLPGPEGQVAWCYYTGENALVAAVFGPDGWVVEPQQILPPGELSPSPLGGVWRNGRVEFVFLRGYYHRPQDSPGWDVISLEMDGQFKVETHSWTESKLEDKGAPSLFAAVANPESGWDLIFSRKDNDIHSLWQCDPKGDWTKLQDNVVEAVTEPSIRVDRCLFGPTGFSPILGASQPIATWSALDKLEKREHDLPEGAQSWDGNAVFQVDATGKLRRLQTMYLGGDIYQLVRDRFLSMTRADGQAVLLELEKPPRPLFQGDFPTGSSDFVFMEVGQSLYCVEFGGQFIELDELVNRS